MRREEKMRGERGIPKRRLGSMSAVDLRRMFTMPMLYVMVGISLVMPILILVMTTAVGGSDGAETAIFTSTWQVVESISGGDAAMSMDMTSMCNINLLFFLAAVLVSVFVADDFRSGYAKNLFTVRARRKGYVMSKIRVGVLGGVLMIAVYFVGSILGGAIAGLSFDTGTAGILGIILCLACKALLMGVFVPIFVVMSVVGRQKLWVSLAGSFCVGMLLFMMLPMVSPLNSGFMNVILCLAGAALFTLGLGVVGGRVLDGANLV